MALITYHQTLITFIPFFPVMGKTMIQYNKRPINEW